MHQMLILPFGILPLVLLAIYLVWKMLEATGQRTITNDRRFGTTEFPTEVSALLSGTNSNELVFFEDGKSVVLKIANAYRELPDCAAAEQYIKESLRGEEVNSAWADELTVTDVVCTELPRSYSVTLTMPQSIVLSTEYIENEVNNLGRVFTRNASNDHRWMLFPKGDRRIEVRDGKVMVEVERVQLVPTFLGNWKDRVMSERQITRNIKNRLWNQVDVVCIGIDSRTYSGEIILPARHGS